MSVTETNRRLFTLAWTTSPNHGRSTLSQHFPVRKQQRRLRLILRRGRRLSLCGQVRQKNTDLGRTHPGGVPLSVKKHGPPCPIEVRLLVAIAAMPHPQRLAHAVEELRRLGRSGISHPENLGSSKSGF